MPLGHLNRLQAWNYTCPVTGFEEGRVSGWSWSCVWPLLGCEWWRNLYSQVNVRALDAGSCDGALQGTAAAGLCKDSSTPAVQQICPDGLPASVHSSRVHREPLLYTQ